MSNGFTGVVTDILSPHIAPDSSPLLLTGAVEGSSLGVPGAGSPRPAPQSAGPGAGGVAVGGAGHVSLSSGRQPCRDTPPVVQMDYFSYLTFHPEETEREDDNYPHVGHTDLMTALSRSCHTKLNKTRSTSSWEFSC